ncbi:hypothetical protein [Amnibacterium endophyticum]|uniref:Uncharacterized protein n=1 Tax=Amnibacterium endophyticum TaxID=2109337 RepID=A0ABW4LE34_9MICO
MSGPDGVRSRSSGTYVLVIGAIVIAVCLVVLSLLTRVAPAIATTVIVLDVLLVAAMLVARFTIRPIGRRQWTITGCLLAACVLSLGAVVLIAALTAAA